MEKTKELNAIDIEFYEAAMKRFVGIIEADEKYRRKCQEFKRIQNIASPAMKFYGDVGRYMNQKYRLFIKN